MAENPANSVTINWDEALPGLQRPTRRTRHHDLTSTRSNLSTTHSPTRPSRHHRLVPGPRRFDPV